MTNPFQIPEPETLGVNSRRHRSNAGGATAAGDRELATALNSERSTRAADFCNRL